MFDSLVELSHLVSKTKVKQVEIIGEKSNRNSLFQQLYEGILSGKFSTDEAAAQALYGKSSDYPAYQKLQYRLEKRLLNTLFHIDVNGVQFNTAQKAYYSCYINLASVNILAGRAASKNAIKLAEKTIKIAIKYEFTLVVYDMARILAAYYSHQKKNNVKFKKYNQLMYEYIQILVAEETASRYENELKAMHAGKFANTVDSLPIAIQYSKEMKKLIPKYNSYHLKRTGFNIIVLRYEIDNDYINCIKPCDQAIAFFEKKHSANYKIALFYFIFKQLAFYTTLQQYEKAENCAIKCLNQVTTGTRNWFITLESYILLCFHSKNYTKAYSILVQAKKHSRFKDLHIEIRELWTIYEAYLHYFIRLNLVDLCKEKKQRLPKFRYKKFLNSVPTYSQDKHGLNIAILVVNILFLLEDEQYDEVLNRIENSQKYAYRALKKDINYRSIRFLKLLGVLVRAKFHRRTIEQKAQKYLNQLAEQPLGIAKTASYIEIVPYEQLWNCVLESIDTTFWHRNNRRKK